MQFNSYLINQLIKNKFEFKLIHFQSTVFCDIMFMSGINI